MNVQKAFSSREVDSNTIIPSAKNTSFEARYVKIDQERSVVYPYTTEQTLISAELSRLSDVVKKTTNGVVYNGSKWLCFMD